MIIKKYKAPTENEAIIMAKEELGKDAIVMNVKTIKPKGIMRFFKKAKVELTAAVDDNVEMNTSVKSTADDKNQVFVVNRGKNSDIDLSELSKVDLGSNDVKKEISTKLDNSENKVDSKKSEERKYRDIYYDGKEDYSEDAKNAIEEKINSIAKLLEQQMKNTKIENVEVDSAKKEVADAEKDKVGEHKNKVIDLIRNKLIENEVSEEFSDVIISELSANDEKTPIDNILASAYQKIVLKLGKIEPLCVSEKKPKVVFFVGNTGVGKTTTMAKLASKSMLEDKKRIAMISVDTYRIAAIEQIKTYANILGAPMEVVYTPEEMVSCVNKYNDYDYIFVDTAGRSHRNDEQKKDLEDIISAVDEFEKEVYLVLSATVKYSDLRNIAETYDKMFDYKFIFTKLDETCALGCILNLKMEMDKTLSYVTWGQNVPDDMGVLNPQIIAKKLLGGGE